jgi:alpha-L-fucosidase
VVTKTKFALLSLAKISLLLFLFLGLLAPSAHSQTSATAPTNTTLAAEPMDSLWIEANQKYSAQRTALLREVDRQAHDGPFRPDWGSLKNYQEPQWYKDAKFGIFIHWGLYSVPAFGNEWYSRDMYVKGSKEYEHHIATYGRQDKFGYKDFIPLFKAEHYDPQAWARLFKEAGAKYVVPVAEHHDGFPMYQSDLTDWSAAKMGPKRDLIGDLAKAVRSEGLHFGASSHRAEHDWFFGEGRYIPSDVNDPKLASFYGPAHPHLSKEDANLIDDWTYVSDPFMDDWLARTAELIERYHPDLIYFDWWIGQPSWRNHLSRLAAFYYNYGAARGTGAVINYKQQDFEEHSGTLDVERGQLAEIRPEHWQTCTSISNASWGYIEHDTYKPAKFLIHQLVDIGSKNGNLLLIVGPRADGTIPQAAQDTLLGMGQWLKINGEAIYGTSPWKQFGEGPTRVAEGSFHDAETKPFTAEDFRFTSKDKILYAIELGWPAGSDATIHSLAGMKIRRVALLGSKDSIHWQQQADGLHLQLPQAHDQH